MTKPTVIFILGMHRSGTSALAGALAASGAWLGDDLLEPAPGVNEKGFWEHKDLVVINEALLERAGLHWYSPLAGNRFASFEANAAGSIEDLRELAVRFATNLLYQAENRDSSVVAIKDPRLCLTAMFWQRVFEEAGARVAGLELVRHPVEVARSLERRDGIVPSHANVLWLDHVLASTSFCRGLDATFLGSYDDLMASPRGFTELAFKELDVPLRPKPDELDKWIRQGLRHHAGTHSTAPGLLGDEVSLLYAEMIQRGALDDTTTSQLVNRVSAVFEDLEAQFQRYNKTVIQHQGVCAKLEELGRDHARALKVVAERDEELADVSSNRDRLGALHQKAQDTVALRDKELAGRDEALTEKNEFIEQVTQDYNQSIEDLAVVSEDLAVVSEQLQNLGDQHHHAQLVVAERDQQLEALNHRIASFEQSLIGRIYRIWSRLRSRISRHPASNDEGAIQSSTSAVAGVTRFPKRGQRPAVDVIIPVYGGFEETRAAVKTAADSIDYGWARLVVINDCSPLPEITQWLRENQRWLDYELLENETNLGFVGTVNRGMRLRPEADVLLLNSDVEVANNWLERLQDCAYSRQKVASVTATANNATICSFPVFCEDNELPLGFDVKRLDEVFAQAVPRNMAVEIPTGVGCCMYMRRDSMDAIGLFDEEVFGRGYGEENDWCQRAIADGWSNLHALNVFVYHKGAVSFAEESNPRILENLRKLEQRFPHYHKSVHNFIRLNPAKGWLRWVYFALLRQSGKVGVLAVSHGMGGGVNTNIKEIGSYLDEVFQVVLEPIGDSKVRLCCAYAPEELNLAFDVETEYELLLAVLESLAIRHVHFHHTMGVPTRLWALPYDLGVEYDYTLHDFWVINGNPTQTDISGVYVPRTDVDRDNKCSESYPLPESFSGWQWRESQLPLMKSARYLICPSFDTAKRIKSEKEFRDLDKWLVAPHLDHGELPLKVNRFNPGERAVRVVVLGALSKEKGADLLEQTAISLSTENIEFHLLGYAYRPLNPVVRTHGAYPEEEGHERLSRLQPDVIWFPAQWPETYSYTLSLALKGQYPVVAPELGAFVERLARRPRTVLLSEWSNSECVNAFWNSVIKKPELLEWSRAPSLEATEDVSYLEDFYHAEYLELKPFDDSSDLSKNDRIVSKLISGAQLLPFDERNEKILRVLIVARSTKLGVFFSRLLPMSFQRYFKRKLSRKPIHDVVK